MAIHYDKENKVFLLHTPATTYAIGIVDETYLGHIYYGPRLQDVNIRYLLREDEPPFIPSQNQREKNTFLDTFPMEYPEFGMGDYRESALCIQNSQGYLASEAKYKGYEITPGKPVLSGLPATFGTKEDCTTLCIRCHDEVLHMELFLYYTVFEHLDVITRHVEIQNDGTEAFYLKRVLSACLDMDDLKFESVTLHGSWARERQIQRMPIGYGRQNAASFKGISSHQEHPFLALVTPETTQDTGEVYAMHFVYSGNFLAQVEKNQFDLIRMTMGIHPQGFSWKLLPGERFTAPEVVMTYSDAGFGKMTRTFHDLYRAHLIRSPYQNKKRPVLINNWEGTYFDFDEKKLYSIAKEATELGIELFVMDDGWFGHRDNDDSSLGDWTVNEKKLKGGLPHLVEQIKGLGMKFGIWFEPEMISLDSNLFVEHPDWAIQIQGRDITESRAQYVLDLSRAEVIEYVYKSVADILKSADITYVKWDMNRLLTTVGSSSLASDCQGELYHKFILGVYSLQERIVNEFPDLLLENCASGGARFDPGMLYYSPQIWCSDNTDAICRLSIFEGTALLYPLSCIGAHVSVCPNHTVGRNTPFETRGNLAVFGTFGYELDLTKLSEHEKSLVKEQVKEYHHFHELVRDGDYYRLASYQENHSFDSFMIVSKEKEYALLFYIQVLARPNVHSRFLRLKGLLKDAVYEAGERTYTGSALMQAGYRIPSEQGDFKSLLLPIHIKRE